MTHRIFTSRPSLFRAAMLALATCTGDFAAVHAASLNFTAEASRATAALSCPAPKTLAASPPLGALYSCILGRAQTVKWFINEAHGTGQVLNVKLMWNDWFKDIGDGLHADKAEMHSAVRAFAVLYAPKHEQRLQALVAGSVAGKVETGEAVISYTYRRGPMIDERLLTLIPKGKALAAAAPTATTARGPAVDEAAACRARVSEAAGYPANLVFVDADPVQETGYKSFMARGRGKDRFFCEVHPDNRYRVKAALDGNFPFKYIAEGQLTK